MRREEMTSTSTDATGTSWETVEIAELPPLTPTQVAWRRFRRHKMAIAGIFMLLGIILYVTLGSFLFTEAEANITDLSITLQPPSSEHPFGTETYT
jgi:peptide/nickel transport system permease protein